MVLKPYFKWLYTISSNGILAIVCHCWSPPPQLAFKSQDFVEHDSQEPFIWVLLVLS